MRIFLTGSSSGIGEKLIATLTRNGFEVFRLQRSVPDYWDLTKELPPSTELDVLIHLAHDREMDIETHVNLNRNIFRNFKGHLIYLSSLSAHSKASSNYGVIKYLSEQEALRVSGSVLRAGVVWGIGDAGIFGMLNRIVQTQKIVPLPLRGQSRLFMTNIDDLILEISSLVKSKSSGTYRAFNSRSETLYTILKKIEKGHQQKVRFILLPKQPFSLFLNISSYIFPKQLRILLDSYFSLENEASLKEISELKEPDSDFATDFKFNCVLG